MSKALEIIRALSEQMSRKEIEDTYDVDKNGIIQDPGKFEGEMVWVPYFYDMAMDGFADESGEGWDFFEISKDDIKMFPELKGGKGMILWYSEQGFVSGETSDKPPEEEEPEEEENE